MRNSHLELQVLLTDSEFCSGFKFSLPINLLFEVLKLEFPTVFGIKLSDSFSVPRFDLCDLYRVVLRKNLTKIDKNDPFDLKMTSLTPKRPQIGFPYPKRGLFARNMTFQQNPPVVVTRFFRFLPVSVYV